MKILVLNCRIYSLEFEVIEMPRKKILAKGVAEKIGTDRSLLSYQKCGHNEERIFRLILDHTRALETIKQVICDPKFGVIKNEGEIAALGHRVVHGGEEFSDPAVLLTDDVKKEINRNIDMAPLHNPYNLKGIEAGERIFPDIPQFAAFDTSYYQSIPQHAYLYAIPYHLYQKHGIRRYGFHGTSHNYVAQETARLLEKPLKKLKMISCHLGAGSSLSAISGGLPVDTSMGFSPIEGLMMTTRSGDIDPEVIFFLLKSGLTLNEVETTLNRESGLLGISGISDNMKNIIEEAEKQDRRAILAIDMFVYRVIKYIGAYYAVLQGIDAISFTGGIGENSPLVREKILSALGFMGINLDRKKNSSLISQAGRISAASSKISVLVIPRNEGILIAQEVAKLLKKT